MEFSEQVKTLLAYQIGLYPPNFTRLFASEEEVAREVTTLTIEVDGHKVTSSSGPNGAALGFLRKDGKPWSLTLETTPSGWKRHQLNFRHLLGWLEGNPMPNHPDWIDTIFVGDETFIRITKAVIGVFNS